MVYQSHGGVIKDGEKVIHIEPGDLITVTTDAGKYQAKNLVITAGPWAKTLLSHTGLQLPLRVLTEPNNISLNHRLHFTFTHLLHLYLPLKIHMATILSWSER